MSRSWCSARPLSLRSCSFLLSKFLFSKVPDAPCQSTLTGPSHASLNDFTFAENTLHSPLSLLKNSVPVPAGMAGISPPNRYLSSWILYRPSYKPIPVVSANTGRFRSFQPFRKYRYRVSLVNVVAPRSDLGIRPTPATRLYSHALRTLAVICFAPCCDSGALLRQRRCSTTGLRPLQPADPTPVTDSLPAVLR